MPPEEEPVDERTWLPRIMAGQMEQMRETMARLQQEIMTSLALPAEEMLRALGSAMRTDMPPRRTHLLDDNGNPLHGGVNFPNPYFAGARESSIDPELLNRTRGVIPAMQHDLRPATGYCGRCNATAVARCYTIGCQHQGVKLCPKHLLDHDGKTLPEGVPHG